MTFATVTYLLFTLYGVIVFRYFFFLIRLIRKYKVGLPVIKEIISEEDKISLKKYQKETIISFFIFLFFMLLLFGLKIKGILFLEEN
jgi:hypothetical protein